MKEYGRTQITAYVDPHHEVYFGLKPVAKSGAIREALDNWIDDNGVSTSELKMAVTIVQQSDEPLESIVDDCDTIEEFVARVNDLLEENEISH